MRLNLHLADNNDLECAVATRFTLRPTLTQAAARILVEQWAARHLAGDDPLALQLVSLPGGTATAYVRPLYQALIERYCRGAPLILTPGEDFVSPDVNAEPPEALAIDLFAVEQLINECGPLLIDCFRQDLVAFWCEHDSSGQTPWQWYANTLAQQFKQALDTSATAGTLDGKNAAAAQLVYSYPWQRQRDQWPNTAHLNVQCLQLDLSAGASLDVDVGSALRVEHPGSVMLFTLVGRLRAYSSPQALFNTFARLWPHIQAMQPRIILTPASGQCFEQQAFTVLEQHLRICSVVSDSCTSEYDAPWLAWTLDQLTSMVGLCDASEQTRRDQLITHLPAWLRNAKANKLARYGAMLIDVAKAYDNAQNAFWLDGIEDAETFSYRLMNEQVLADHPDNTLTLTDIEVVNHQVEAAAIPAQGTLFTDGVITPVKFSLAQLAIGNLGLLRPGRVELRSTSDHALPDWLDEPYVRQLITAVDVGKAYPQMLKQTLLDDPAQRQRRQTLLAAQLRAQVPAHAMELHLRDQTVSEAAVEGISRAFQDNPISEAQRWAISPLGFLSQAQARADIAHNAWLIESVEGYATPCVLYRPMHPEPLLEFIDRHALMVAVSSAGELQTDLIERLPGTAQHLYEHGGFTEPHLFFSVEDTFSVPLGKPAPARISEQPAVDDIGATIYQACVEEAISQFQAHSRSTSQTTWDRWQTLGWLIFNTLLPLARGTVAKAAWLLQMEVALADFAATDPQRNATAHRLALINLLVNVAVLLFSHASTRLYSSLHSETTTSQPTDTPLSALQDAPIPEPALDFSWARADRALSPEQSQALTALQVDMSTQQLGSPIPTGPLRGLYLHASKLWARLNGACYQVKLDEQTQQLRIVGATDSQLPGPWLRRDEAGRLQLDLRLRLHGGMPLPERIQQLQLARQAAVRTLDDTLKAETATAKLENTLRLTIVERAISATDDRLLQGYLTQVERSVVFWRLHLEHLDERAAIASLKDVKILQAQANYYWFIFEKSSHDIRTRQFSKLHKHLLRSGDEQASTLTPEDVPQIDHHILEQRLSDLRLLLDELLRSGTQLRIIHQQLGRLASRQQPKINTYNTYVDTVIKGIEPVLSWRYLRMENSANRLNLLHDLDDQASYWLLRGWGELTLGISQLMRMAKLETPSSELKVRLLGSIREQFNTAQRQLDALAELLNKPSAKQALGALQEDVDYLKSAVAKELAEYPDEPPTNTVAQLRSQVPGLIETDEYGLLLTEARDGDEQMADIPGPVDNASGTTFHLVKDRWVKLDTPSVRRPQQEGHSLKRLLKDSTTLLKDARRVLARYQADSTSNSLPVDIQDNLLQQQQKLTSQREAIQQRLTQSNETDHATQEQDAATTSKALDELGDTLKRQAQALRIQAALRQPPRMTEVLYLLSHSEITIQPQGPRRLLHKTPGRAADYLDEYAIAHDGNPLWYAHFHYPAQGTAKSQFRAGHLKTAAQRLLGGSQTVDPATGQKIDIYRSPITTAAAASCFFDLP